jgi:endoglucanase
MKIVLKSAFLLIILGIAGVHAKAETTLEDIRGVSLPSLEWACVQYDAVHDFPLVETAILLDKWNINTVRLPLNQECWLNNKKYQTEVKKVVSHFAEAKFSIIIDLHWNKPNKAKESKQQVMADKDRSPAFWRSVATAFKNESAVIAFELYNEPHTISWDCWKNGCQTEEGWKVAGMQELVTAVRSTGANQWVIINGLQWANDVPGTVANLPKDPKKKIAIGWHVYDEYDDPNKCTTTECFERVIAPIAKEYKIVITEFGSRLHCDPSHDERVMRFAEKNGIGLVAWAWYPADCGFPALIKDWGGTPTEAGKRYCAFLKGDCPTIATPPVQPTVPTPAPIKPAAPGIILPATPNGQPICYVNFKDGVLGYNNNVSCTQGYALVVTGKSNETWNDRVSSWKVTGPWLAVSAWDYYTTSGRTEKGTEILLPNQKGNNGTSANDRTRLLLIRPDMTGSLTLYDDVNQGGASITFTLKKVQ